jgi:hypothetical protein
MSVILGTSKSKVKWTISPFPPVTSDLQPPGPVKPLMDDFLSEEIISDSTIMIAPNPIWQGIQT